MTRAPTIREADETLAVFDPQMTRLLRAYAAARRRWHGAPEPSEPGVFRLAARRRLRHAA